MRLDVGSAGAVAIAALFAGCGGGSGNVEQSIDDLSVEICDLAFRCCERGEIDYYLGPFVGDQANCAERLGQSASVDTSAGFTIPLAGASLSLPNVGVLEQAVADGRIELDAEALAACIAYLQQLPCNELIEEEEEGCVPPVLPPPTPCDSTLIVIGKVEESGTCTSPSFGFECQTGLTCRAISSLGVEGVCVKPGALGEFCVEDSDCELGLYCSLLDGTCQLPRAIGETCAYADPDDLSPSNTTLLIECEPLLACDPVTDTCVEACSRGAACASDEQCDFEAGLVCILDRCDEPRAAGLPCQTVEDCVLGLRCAPAPGTGELTCLDLIEDGETCSTSRPQDCATGYCDPVTFQCAATSAPGELCPSGLHPQCAGGYCRTTNMFCDADPDCVSLSGTCNLVAGRCEYYCIERLPDGAICVLDQECLSNDCVDGFCRTLPLADGQPCDFSFQCESLFCNFELTPVCEQLPLPNGRVCTSSTQCASGVCFENSCQNGQSEGADCTSFVDPPCALDLYCDREQVPNLCVPLLPAGAACDSSDQCRGACTTRFGRMMCDSTPAEEAAVCDGE